MILKIKWREYGMGKSCVIEQMLANEEKFYEVLNTPDFFAFLDHRPLFIGHTLLVPKLHVQTLMDMPDELLGPLNRFTKKLAQAVQQAMQSQGIFIAMNNKVSQSIPHLHVHIIPRNKGDGLKGFFWPRLTYQGEDHILSTQNKIKQALNQITES